MTRSKIKNISISLIVTCLASVMTGWLSNDVNSDLIISLFCGKTDIEFSDFYNRVLHNSSSKEIDKDIIIVNIDSVYSRRDFSLLLEELNNYHPKLIGIDVLFDTPKDSIEELILKNTIKNASNIILAKEYDQEKDQYKSSIFDSEIDESHFGIVNFVNRNSHSVRSYLPCFNVNGEKKPSFSTRIYQMLSNSRSRTNYEKIDEETIVFPSIGFCEVDARFIKRDSSLITGKIVIVGSLNDSYDQHITPIDDKMPGSLIWAYILSDLINNRCLKTIGNFSEWIIAIVLSFLLCFIYVSLNDTNMQNFCIRIVPIFILIFLGFFGCYLFSQFYLYFNVTKVIITSSIGILILDILYASFDVFNLIKRRYK